MGNAAGNRGNGGRWLYDLQFLDVPSEGGGSSISLTSAVHGKCVQTSIDHSITIDDTEYNARTAQRHGGRRVPHVQCKASDCGRQRVGSAGRVSVSH